MKEWISARDKYPKEGERVIICFMDTRRVNVAYWLDGRYMANEIISFRDPDYWMPLPEPPDVVDETFGKYKGQASLANKIISEMKGDD